MRIFFKDTDRIPELPTGHATAYRLAGQPPEFEGPHKVRVGSDYLHGCRIIQRWTISETDVAAAHALFASTKTYGDLCMGVRCYFPGFGFTFGEGKLAVDVLVCLKCRWVAFHWGGQSISVAPSDSGLACLQETYQTLIERVPTGSDWHSVGGA